jgi:ABC-type branched-subunit amino acid transport system substrate-binding protein
MPAVSGAASDSQTTGISKDEILIGSCLPISSLLKSRTEQILSGAKSYFDYVNDQGGINGRKIKLISCDDGYDPEKAINCFNSCLKGKVFAGALFLGSPAITKYLRMTELDDMPMLGMCTGTQSAYEFRPNVFAFRPSYMDEVHRQIEELWNHGFRKFSLIYQSDAAGAGVRKGIGDELAKRGASPVAEASFARVSVDIEPDLELIKQAHPQVVIVVGATGTVDTIKTRYQQKWQIPFATYDVQRHYFDGVKEGEGLLATQVLPDVDRKLPGIELYRKLLAKYSPKTAPTESGLEGFINARLICEGLKLAGPNLTRAKFVVGMESIHDFDPGLGPNWIVNYSNKNHCGLTPRAVFMSIMHNGKCTPMTDADWAQVSKLSKTGT